MIDVEKENSTLSSYEFRKEEGRTPEEFAECMDVSTAREKQLSDEWVARLLRNRVYTSIIKEDHGVDNTGKVIFESCKEMANADFKMTFYGGGPKAPLYDNWYYVEAKASPCLSKATFKDFNLKAYMREGAFMLLILCRGYENPKKWTLVDPSQMQRILDRIEVRYDNPGFIDKPSVLVPRSRFSEFFSTFYDW